MGEFYLTCLEFLMEHFKDQVRKGDGTPVIAHPVRVSGLVAEGGGHEFVVAAALLHDVCEDLKDGPQILRERLGDKMHDLVMECSDTTTHPKPPWRTRKEQHIAHLSTASECALRILLADKLDNGRSLIQMYEFLGVEETGKKFNASLAEQAWYFRELHKAIEARVIREPNRLSALLIQVQELHRIASRIEELSKMPVLLVCMQHFPDNGYSLLSLQEDVVEAKWKGIRVVMYHPEAFPLSFMSTNKLELGENLYSQPLEKSLVAIQDVQDWCEQVFGNYLPVTSIPMHNCYDSRFLGRVATPGF